MQKIHLTMAAAEELGAKLCSILDTLEAGYVREVVIRAGDPIGQPLSEVDITISVVAAVKAE